MAYDLFPIVLGVEADIPQVFKLVRAHKNREKLTLWGRELEVVIYSESYITAAHRERHVSRDCTQFGFWRFL